jgi:hypothetical protein
VDGDGLGDLCDPRNDNDVDGDGTVNATDRCPFAAATTTSGCPLVSRSVTLAYSTSRQRFRGKVSSSEPECVDLKTVKVFKRRPGPDLKIGQTTTNDTGDFQLSARATSGRYYSMVATKVVAGVAQCGSDTSPNLVIP